MENEKPIEGDSGYVENIANALFAQQEALAQLCKRMDEFEANGNPALGEWRAFHDKMSEHARASEKKSFLSKYADDPDWNEARESWTAGGGEGNFDDEIYELLELAEKETMKAIEDAKSHDENYEGGEFNIDNHAKEILGRYLKTVRGLRGMKPIAASVEVSNEAIPIAAEEIPNESEKEKQKESPISDEEKGREIVRNMRAKKIL
jgi:hypothetical protein